MTSGFHVVFVRLVYLLNLRFVEGSSLFYHYKKICYSDKDILCSLNEVNTVLRKAASSITKIQRIN